MSDGCELPGINELLLAAVVDFVKSGKKFLQLPLQVVVVRRRGTFSLVGHDVDLEVVWNDDIKLFDIYFSETLMDDLMKWTLKKVIIRHAI